MGFFDNFFDRFKKKESKTTSNTSNKQQQGMMDVLLNFYKTNQLSWEDFENRYLQPRIEEQRKNSWFVQQLEERKDAFYQQYLMAYAVQYAIFHIRDNAFMKKAIDYSSQTDDTMYQFRTELFKNVGYNQFKEQEYIREQTNAAIEYLRCYYSIYHHEKNNNIALPSRISSVLSNFRTNEVNHEKFKILFEYIEAQDYFRWKPLSYISAFIAKKINYKNGHSSATDVDFYKEELLQALQNTITEHNTLHKQQIDFELLLDLMKQVFSFITTEKYLNWDHKKRKSIKAKDHPPVLAFVEKYNDRVEEVIEHLLWSNFQYQNGSEIFHYFQIDLIKTLVKNKLPSLEWTQQFFSKAEYQKNFNLFEVIYFPVFEKRLPAFSYDHPIRKQFEKILFGHQKGFYYKKQYQQKRTVLHELTNTINDREKRLFHQLKYNSLYSQSHSGEGAVINLDPKDKQHHALNQFIKELSKLIPISLKSIPKTSALYYNEDRPLFIINYKNKDYEMRGNYLEVINGFLQEENTGYRYIMIPVASPEDGYFPLVSALSLLNHTQHQYLLQTYLPDYFPGLVYPAYFRHMEYNKKDAIPYSELALAEDTFQQMQGNQFLADVRWNWFKEKYIDELSSNETWYSIMDTMIQNKGVKKPNQKWLDEIMPKVNAFGKEQYYKELNVLIRSSIKEDFWFNGDYEKAMRGIIFTCTAEEVSDASAGVVRTIVEAAYTKIPGIGPRGTKIGNFGLEALATSGSEKAFGVLNLMRNKSKYNRFVNAIDKYLETFKAFSDIPEELLADKTIPDFGFENGIKKIALEQFQLDFSFKNGKLIKNWFDSDGNKLRSIPEELKINFPKKIKEITEETKQINSVFKDLLHRLRTFWLFDRTWSGADWKQYIFEHPFVNIRIQYTIWYNQTKGEDFIILENQLKKVDGSLAKIDITDEIKFWHPVNASPEHLSAWQDKIWQNKIKQPIRQAFREHYPFSDTEKEMEKSPRFAHHFLQVKKLMAVANASGWIFTYVHEDVNWPRKYIKALNITAHIDCQYSRNDFAIPTKELFFTKGDCRKISFSSKFEHLKINAVPASTRSEICRDVDLFIATTSVANDPELSKSSEALGHYRDAFYQGKFSDNASAKIRKRIIEQLISVLQIPSPGFEGNYLIINGTLNQYRVNLGSGFAQIKDSQKHLNLLPDVSAVKKNKKIRLPIEDDETLYIILAKALFLKDDGQIKDEKLRALLKEV